MFFQDLEFASETFYEVNHPQCSFHEGGYAPIPRWS